MGSLFTELTITEQENLSGAAEKMPEMKKYEKKYEWNFPKKEYKYEWKFYKKEKEYKKKP